MATSSTEPASTVDLNFGLKVQTEFYLPKGKQVDANGDGTMEDIVYEFTGDDDLWVFIDNQLVLDIGGGHTEVSGSINFTTGKVWVEKYTKMSFSGNDCNVEAQGTDLYLDFDFEEDAMLAENQWIRLHFPIYLNGTEEENLHNLYLFTQYEPNFPDEQVEYYSALEDLPAGLLYAVPTVFPDTTGEVLDIYHYPARQLTEISYCFPDDRYFSATCRVTAGGELTVSKEQSMVHNGITFYYEFGESGSEFKPLTVGFYLKGRDAVGDRTVACTVYLEMNRYIEPELFIKGIRIMES